MAQICPRCSEPTGDASTRCLECGTPLYPNRSNGPKGATHVVSKLLEPVTAPPAPSPSPAAPDTTRLPRSVRAPSATLSSAPATTHTDQRAPRPKKDLPPAQSRFDPDPFPAERGPATRAKADQSRLDEPFEANRQTLATLVDPEFLEQINALALSSSTHTSMDASFFGTYTPDRWQVVDEEESDLAHPDPFSNPPGEEPQAALEPAEPAEEPGKDHFALPDDFEPRSTLQALDTRGHWRNWASIPAEGLSVGRAEDDGELPELSTLAAQHMRFSYELGMLTVEDLGSLNGIYLRLTEPVPLVDGMRFRIGGHTLEFREVPPHDPSVPSVSVEGEEFCGKDLALLAMIDLIRPNGLPGPRFPITRPDTTVIGREGPGAHIALTDDHAVSTSHARLTREDGLFYLEDLNSRHGTFVQVRGASPVGPGDIILAGRVLFRVSETARA